MYPQSEGNGSISDASTIAKEDLESREVFSEALDRYQAKNNDLDKAYAMVAEYCAIGKESKRAEDGRRALEHTRAERLVVWNFGEKDIKTIRVILAANGIYAVDMTDIDAMGIPDPGGYCRHIDDWKSNDGREARKPGAHCSIWLHEDQASSTFDSRWVPPVGGAPSRRTSTSTRRCVRHQRCNDWVTKPSA